jgi:hypothetical protein
LAMRIDTRESADQTLLYMHHNPLQEHWKLCGDPNQYRFSSAQFYDNGVDDFGILTHNMDRI